MKTNFPILIVFYCAMNTIKNAYSQDSTLCDTAFFSQSFLSLPDGIIKEELSTFVITNKDHTNTSNEKTLEENGNFDERKCSMEFSDYGTGVYISSKEIDNLPELNNRKAWGWVVNQKNEQFSHILFRWRKYHIDLPNCAFEDLYGLNLCAIPEKKKRRSNSAVYTSSDNSRTYIHLIIGSEQKYEVTFIFTEYFHYYGRIINEL